MTEGKLSARQAILALLVCPDRELEGGQFNFGAPIQGKTRLMKELFLIQKETAAGAAGLLDFEFTAAPYGPASSAVQAAQQELVEEGKVKLELYYINAYEVKLTAPGVEEAQKVWLRLGPETRASFYTIKSHYRDLSYRSFMVYVYRTYPEFTTNSDIKDQIMGDQAGE